MRIKGENRGIMERGKLPTDMKPGDYWKESGVEGWYIAVPMSYGEMIGWLKNHTVREHEDGTISVRPGDGSSNSILITSGRGTESWHGYIEHGELYEA